MVKNGPSQLSRVLLLLTLTICIHTAIYNPKHLYPQQVTKVLGDVKIIMTNKKSLSGKIALQTKSLAIRPGYTV